MPPVSGTSLPALRPSATRLTPYAASGLAEHQLRIEEQRVRDKMAERLRRKEAKSKEVLRRKVVALAMEEMSRQPDPRASAAEMDEQKRYLAYLGTLRSDERYFHQRSNPHARWYEATLDEREARDAAWCQRRVEHRMVSDARTSQIMVRTRPTTDHATRLCFSLADKCVGRVCVCAGTRDLACVPAARGERREAGECDQSPQRRDASARRRARHQRFGACAAQGAAE